MCDTFVVVRPGEVLFGKNSDRDPNEAQRLEWHPRRRHSPGARLDCTWLTIPEVAETHATIISRPYWMWGAEMGANEHGLVAGNEAVFTREPLAEVGLTGMDLVRLALERAASAEEALEVIGDLIARHGQGGRAGYDHAGFRYHNSFLLADASGAFVLEVAGKRKAVERVANGLRAISNGLTIPALSKRADPLRGAVAECRARRGRVETLARSARTPADLAAVLRDHGRGRAMPRYRALNGAMAAPCMHAGGIVASSQTVASFIARLTPEGAHHYATATAAPCLSGFKPVAIGSPLDLGAPTGVADEVSVYWRFERLHRAVVGNPARTRAVREARDRWERATWDGTRSPAEAFADWERFVAGQETAPERDERPFFVRRYWAVRDLDARAAVPRLPVWPSA